MPPHASVARKESTTRVAEVYAIIGDQLRLDWLHDRIVELPRADRWDALARNALREDAAAQHRIELVEHDGRKAGEDDQLEHVQRCAIQGFRPDDRRSI